MTKSCGRCRRPARDGVGHGRPPEYCGVRCWKYTRADRKAGKMTIGKTTQKKVRTCCPMGHGYAKHSRFNSRGARECVLCREAWAKRYNEARSALRREARRLAREVPK